ncbi:MAG TPA: TonB-dependent receptor, partial [Segetibacter sp.]
MKKLFIPVVFLLINVSVKSQVKIIFTVYDSVTHGTVAGATVINSSTKKGSLTNASGTVTILSDTTTPHAFVFSMVNYKAKTVVITTTVDTAVIIFLPAIENELEEVIVSSSRTNSRLEDLPTKVEVLGAEEVAEENGIKPGNIASLLGDIAGIQIQQTSAATGNADMRIQGVPGKYTQLLRDGMPLFSGYGGSFSILQIPPLDLQQIELVKGASSTLYGGGAIAGMVNLISKKPVKGAPVRSVTLNRSTLNENNINSFFSNQGEKTGYTLFAGSTIQEAFDVNKDGFSDVPGIKSVFIHPRLFFYADPSSTLVAGYTFNYEDRKGGDMQALANQKNAEHQFFIQNKSLRNTVDINWDKKLDGNAFFTVKGSASFFNRDINTNVFGMKANQTSWYTEAAYSKKGEAYTFVAGVNYNGEDFRKRLPDSSLLTNYNNSTIGLFAQNDYKLNSKLTAQTGLRTDLVHFTGNKNLLLLPRLSLMYKLNSQFTARVGGGLGYKLPTPFTAEVDERDYKYLAGLFPTNKAE